MVRVPICPHTTVVRAKNISPRPIQYLKQPYNICMQSAPESAQRRSIRLRGYDYAQAGAYFITICTHNRTHLFERSLHADIVGLFQVLDG